MTRKITDEHLAQHLRRNEAGDWVWHEGREDGDLGLSEARARGLYFAHDAWVAARVTADELDEAIRVLAHIRERLEVEQRERDDAALLERLGDLIPADLDDRQRAAVVQGAREGIAAALWRSAGRRA